MLEPEGLGTLGSQVYLLPRFLPGNMKSLVCDLAVFFIKKKCMQTQILGLFFQGPEKNNALRRIFILHRRRGVRPPPVVGERGVQTTPPLPTHLIPCSALPLIATSPRCLQCVHKYALKAWPLGLPFKHDGLGHAPMGGGCTEFMCKTIFTCKESKQV